MNVAVVIGVYNEEATIGRILGSLRDYYVVVVDDNSSDGTAELLRKHNHSNVSIITHSHNRGIASSYREGFLFAIDTLRADYIVQMDAGMSHDPDLIPAMLIAATQNPSIVLLAGCRLSEVKWLGVRTILSVCVAKLFRYVLHIPINDVTCGFRVWRAKALKAILDNTFISHKDFSFNFELLYNAWQISDGKVMSYDIPYVLTNSSLSIKKVWDAICTLKDIWKREW